MLNWNESTSLDPLAVYTTAIELMYGLSQQPWSSEVELERSGLTVVHSPGVIIYTQNDPPSPSLTTGLVVRALREMVFAMAEKQPGFFHVTSSLMLQGQKIGKILVDSLPRPLLGNSKSNITLDASQLCQSPSVKTTLETRSGNIVDPNDNRFQISYQYHDRKIEVQNTFSALLDGLSKSAQCDDDGLCPFLTALSFNSDTVIHIGHVDGEALFGWHISRSLYLLLSHVFLVQCVFREMAFSLSYYGTKIADGYIMQMGPGVNDAHGGLMANA